MAGKNDANELKSIVEQGKEAAKQLNAELKTTKALAAESLSPFKSLVGIFDQLEQHKSRENQLSSDQLKKLAERVKLEKENLVNSEKALDARLGFLDKESKKLQDILKLNHGNSKAYKDASKALQDVQKEINNNSKAQDDLRKKIEDTTGEVEELEKSLNKAAKTAVKLEVLNKIGKGLDKIQTPIDDMLNPMALFNKLIGFTVKTVLEFDKRLGDTAKSMNLTYKEAEDSNRAMI
jgi:chromosome segregation ATPase